MEEIHLFSKESKHLTMNGGAKTAIVFILEFIHLIKQNGNLWIQVS